jgi:hypothetical protein
MPATATPLVSRARLGSAAVIALLTAAFNRDTALASATNAALWLAIGSLVAYLVFTAMGLAGDRIWAD